MHSIRNGSNFLTWSRRAKSPVMMLMNTHLAFHGLTPIASRNRQMRTRIQMGGNQTGKFVTALVRGYRVTGNEFDIISSGFYAAKNGPAGDKMAMTLMG
jgi:hypothetical protein